MSIGACGPVAPRLCGTILGAIDPLLLPCFTEGETESWSTVLRGYIASKEQSWGLNPSSLTPSLTLIWPPHKSLLWFGDLGGGGCDSLPGVTVNTLHSYFGRALYHTGALPEASCSTRVDLCKLAIGLGKPGFKSPFVSLCPRANDFLAHFLLGYDLHTIKCKF